MINGFVSIFWYIVFAEITPFAALADSVLKTTKRVNQSNKEQNLTHQNVIKTKRNWWYSSVKV
jgi:hypothetical protein